MAELTTVVVDGLALANDLRERMTREIVGLTGAGKRAPCLAVVLVGDDPASASYIKGKRRACARIGMDSVEHKLAADATQADLLALVDKLNRHITQEIEDRPSDIRVHVDWMDNTYIGVALHQQAQRIANPLQWEAEILASVNRDQKSSKPIRLIHPRSLSV